MRVHSLSTCMRKFKHKSLVNTVIRIFINNFKVMISSSNGSFVYGIMLLIKWYYLLLNRDKAHSLFFIIIIKFDQMN